MKQPDTIMKNLVTLINIKIRYQSQKMPIVYLLKKESKKQFFSDFCLTQQANSGPYSKAGTRS